MSNPLGELSNEISFEERQAQQQQEETEKAQAERYCQDQAATTTAAICKTDNDEDEHVFGSQFTYSDYLFDGNSNSASADLQPGPTCSAGDQQSAILPASPLEPAASLLSLPPSTSTSILSFSALEQSDQPQQLPPFSSHRPQATTDYLSGVSDIVDPSDNLPANEYMLFDASMLDTASNLSAMQETSGTPSATTKVVEYFTSPPPLQSALSHESSNLDSMSRQLSLEAHHHVQSQTQQLQQENANFGHYSHSRMNGNGATGSGVHSEIQVQVPSDTNNNPVTEDLKENISGLLSENAPRASNPVLPTNSSANMDPNGHSVQQQSHVNQYMTPNSGQQLMDTTNSNNNTMDSNGQRQTMTTHQQTHSSPQTTVPTSESSEGQSSLLDLLPKNYPCYSDESQLHHQIGFSGNNEPALGNQQQTCQDSHQLGSTDPQLYHSHHLSQMQPSQSQAPPPPVSQQQQQQSIGQHHRPMSSQANQQLNHHGQTMSVQQQQHPMVTNAPSTPSINYGQPLLMTSSSSSIDTMSSSSAAMIQQSPSSQSANPNPSGNAATVDTMLKTSTPQLGTASTNAEIKPEADSYEATSTDYMAQSTQGPGSSQYHQSIHHAEGQGQMCTTSSSASASASLSSTNAPQQPLTNTAHQRTHAYIPPSESNRTSAANSVNQPAGGGAIVSNQANGGVSATEPSSNTSTGSGSGQILSGFEPVDGAPSGSQSSRNQQSQQAPNFAYIKCEQSQQTTLSYPEDSKSHPNVQQMQFEVSQQPSQPMQPRLSLNDSNVSSSHPPSDENLTSVTARQVQQVQPPQQQPQLPQLLNPGSQQQPGTQVRDDCQSQQQAGQPPSSAAGSFPVPSNSQNSQLCISLPSSVQSSGLQSQVPTVTMTGMPANNSGLRPVCVIADPSEASLPPMHQTSAAQVNVTTFSPLPPKKIRFASNASVVPGNSSLPSQSQQQPIASTALLFASKSSVAPNVPASPVSHQSSSLHNSNVVQTMILPSNLSSFNQAQSIQSQLHSQNAINLVANLPATSAPSLQNVSAKSFVPSSGNSEQSYSAANILQQARQFMSPSSLPSSSASAPSYATSGVSSSVQSGSHYSRVQHVASTAAANVVSSQGQIFFNSVAPNATNIRFLDPNGNYSIVSLQPATVQQGRHQQHQQTAQATKSQTVTQKIMLHSVPVSDNAESNNTSSTPAATALISLNPKFALNANSSQMATLGHLPALNNGPSGSQQLPTGSIIFSSLPLPGASNIPGSHTSSRSVTNFAVPIPVVTSATGEHRSENLTIASIQQAAMGQFAPAAFVQNASQPAILTNLLPTSGAPVTALATKSNKTPGIHKSAPKSGNGSAAVSKSGAASSSASTSGKSSINPPPLMSDDPAKPFKCCLCGKNLASKNVYQLHLRSHSGEKPFSCQLCSNRFSQKTSLTRHMRSHTGERPFPCQVCNKRFADKERIKIHMRIHTGEKPFSCIVCGKKFSQKSTVKRHMSVHTGVKPFKCEICAKGFANRGNLTAHTKTHQSQQSHANRPAAPNTTATSSNHHTQASTMPHQISIELQAQLVPPNSASSSNIVYTSSAGTNSVSVASNNGVRVAIAKSEETDNVPGDNKNSSNAHNHHQFTSATPSIQAAASGAPSSQGPQSQQQQHQPAPLSS